MQGPNNEIQRIVIGGGATGGNFTLAHGGPASGAIAFGAAAAAVRAALEALPSIGVGNVAVTGTGTAGDPYVATFQGALKNTDVAPLTANAAGLTPAGTVTITTTAQGNQAVLEVCYTVDGGAYGGVRNKEWQPGQVPDAGTLLVDKDSV